MKILIDGKECECQAGQNVLDVAMENGIDIPTLCFNELISDIRPAGCRMCIVEILAGGRPGLESSCTLPVNDGLSVSTKSQAVYNERREIIELLLSEHEQDCRNCAISGECNFAKLCRDYDVDGVPVCSECPNQKEGCLLSRGVLCLGPITYANCNAYCTSKGDPCESCFSVLSNEDVLKFGIRAFAKAGFTKEEIIEGAKVFSYDSVKVLEKLIIKEELR